MGFERRNLTAVCIFFCQRRHGKPHAYSQSVPDAQCVSHSHTFSFALTHSNFRLAYASINGNCEE